MQKLSLMISATNDAPDFARCVLSANERRMNLEPWPAIPQGFEMPPNGVV
jgi:hypothetical protein